MRPLPRALLLLGLLALAPAAAAESRAGSRSRGPDAAAIEAARRFLCPHGGTPVRGLRGRCRGGAGGEGMVSGWDAGLPPPARRQAPCPEGTVAVAALARQDATRCVPR
ncbi:hypothetical protein [Siccirubricoccus sp. G192]|uniref:hypothetical protein n=1 Tax=Siccirubricoccus sp. G192 TaxID=2849651 RepID=UPI001C2C1D64|nr:hypothetical protein [Siccirubricoccus sp. G192]MBV1799470.1 hypothetical protein [Siccirubricoccus sp. G192]